MGNLKITAITSVEVTTEFTTANALNVKGRSTITTTGPTHISGTVYKEEGQVATFNGYGVGGNRDVNFTSGNDTEDDIAIITAIKDFTDNIADLRPDTAIVAVNTSSND